MGVVVVVLVVVVVKLLSDMELVVLLLHEDNANVVMSAIRINFILLIFISSLSYCLVIWLPIGIYRGFLAKVGFVLNSLGIQKAQRTFKFSGLEIVLFCGMAGLKHLRDLKIILIRL